MIKVTVLYPNNEDKNFNLQYYMDVHIPLVKRRLGDTCKKVEVEKGIVGDVPGSMPANIVIGYLYFDSVENFQNAFSPHANEIMGDIANFTTINPIVQISEVLL